MKRIFVLILANCLALSLFAQGKDLGPITSLFTDYYAGKDSVAAKNTVYYVRSESDGSTYRLQNKLNKYSNVPSKFESGEQIDVYHGELISTDSSVIEKIFRDVLSEKNELKIIGDGVREIYFFAVVDSKTGRIIEFRFFKLNVSYGQRNIMGCISPFEIEEIENRMKEEVVFDVSRFREIPPVNFIVKAMSVSLRDGEIRVWR